MENSPSTDSSDIDSITKKISFPDHEQIALLCGEQDSHLKIIGEKVGLSVNHRGNSIILQGGDWEIELAEKILNQLYGLISKKYPVFSNDVGYAIRILSKDPSCDLGKVFMDKVYISSRKKIQYF